MNIFNSEYIQTFNINKGVDDDKKLNRAHANCQGINKWP